MIAQAAFYVSYSFVTLVILFYIIVVPTNRNSIFVKDVWTEFANGNIYRLESIFLSRK
jgi:hypothetical protein